jgi:hypothetical protein
MTAEATSMPSHEQKSAWYRPTPERFVWMLLFVEIFLWLSDRYRWFAFNESKGLTVLIALAALFISLLGFAVGFLTAWIFRRRFQFGIRTLLLLTLATAIPFSWLAVSIERAKRTGEIARLLEKKLDCNMETRVWLSPSIRLTNLLGEDFFTHVTFICHQTSDFSDDDFKLCCELDELEICMLNGSAVTDVGLENIGNLTRLKYLDLRDTPITDAGLKHLAKLHSLEKLYLSGTDTTEAGLQELQSKLPRCKVTW